MPAGSWGFCRPSLKTATRLWLPKPIASNPIFLNEASPLWRTFHLFVLQVPTKSSLTPACYSSRPPNSTYFGMRGNGATRKETGERSQADTQEESERCQENRELSGPVQDHPSPGAPAPPSLSATPVPSPQLSLSNTRLKTPEGDRGSSQLLREAENLQPELPILGLKRP